MHALPENLYTTSQTRELDNLVIHQYQLAAGELMRRAGEAAFTYLQRQWPNTVTLLIVCGTGNNGGDGYEVARQAKSAGLDVTVIELGNTEKMSIETQSARHAMLDTGISPRPFKGYLPANIDIIVDAIFGTGLDRSVTDVYAELISAINSLKKPVLSLDIPSGLNADTGNVQGIAVKATVTVSFIGLNVGLFTGDAADYVGELIFDSLDIPEAVYDQLEPVAQRIKLTSLDYQHLLQPRLRNSHKGNFGHSLIIGGDSGMPGSIRLAAEAAARSGSGLVSVATREQHAVFINIAQPELMCYPMESQRELTPLLNKATNIGIGPGLGQSSWSSNLFNAVLATTLPMVVDADALNLLAKHPCHRANWILTPHPGEAARLLNCSNLDIQADRISSIKRLQRQYGGVIVLKGSGTLIYDGSSPVKVISYGNPGMSSGGMGDVLTGIITSLLAQQLPLRLAAELGVMLHGLAADIAAMDGERGLLASDLFIPLRRLLNP